MLTPECFLPIYFSYTFKKMFCSDCKNSMLTLRFNRKIRAVKRGKPLRSPFNQTEGEGP